MQHAYNTYVVLNFYILGRKSYNFWQALSFIREKVIDKIVGMEYNVSGKLISRFRLIFRVGQLPRLWQYFKFRLICVTRDAYLL